jgi:hypothetical protein
MMGGLQPSESIIIVVNSRKLEPVFRAAVPKYVTGSKKSNRFPVAHFP